METKTCTKCLTEYPMDHFAKKGSGRSTRCSKCVAEYFKEYYHNNPDRKAKHIERVRQGKIKNQYKILAKKYGVTEEEVISLLTANNGVCVLCEERPATCIDHCHTTGKVRGALCSQCNSGLGFFKDDVRTLENAIRYLSGVSPLADNE